MQCDDVLLHLAQLPPDVPNEHLALPVRHHVATCLPCQAERSQYRRLNRELRSIRYEQVLPDERLLEEILDSVRPKASVVPIRPRRKAYVGGIAAAATAAGAGAIVLVTKLSSKGHRLAG